MLNDNGVVTIERLKTKFPDDKYLVKSKAVTECYEAIPCNPCSTSCPFEAIHIGEDINTPPKVNFDKCIGCGICVYNCPGLAIFIVKELDDYLEFKIPYEFVPYPIKGEVCHAVNRHGDIIGKCEIIKAQINDKFDKTMLLTVKVDKSMLYDFITIRRIV